MTREQAIDEAVRRSGYMEVVSYHRTPGCTPTVSFRKITAQEAEEWLPHSTFGAALIRDEFRRIMTEATGTGPLETAAGAVVDPTAASGLTGVYPPQNEWGYGNGGVMPKHGTEGYPQHTIGDPTVGSSLPKYPRHPHGIERG